MCFSNFIEKLIKAKVIDVAQDPNNPKDNIIIFIDNRTIFMDQFDSFMTKKTKKKLPFVDIIFSN